MYCSKHDEKIWCIDVGMSSGVLDSRPEVNYSRKDIFLALCLVTGTCKCGDGCLSLYACVNTS